MSRNLTWLLVALTTACLGPDEAHYPAALKATLQAFSPDWGDWCLHPWMESRERAQDRWAFIETGTPRGFEAVDRASRIIESPPQKEPLPREVQAAWPISEGSDWCITATTPIIVGRRALVSLELPGPMGRLNYWLERAEKGWVVRARTRGESDI